MFIMSKNESRRERKNQEEQVSSKSNSGGISKVYYWIIGALFLVLILLIVFIFSRSGDDLDLGEEEDQTALVQDAEDENAEKSEAPTENEQTDSQEDQENQDNEENQENESDEETNSEEDTEEDANNEENAEEDAAEDESTTVTEDAPLDTDHATDYSNGSADRVEIKERVMDVTGLSDDLIEHWVGNDGPGRVVATVSSRDQSENYEVYLQYGNGSWHVTSYERLD